MNVSKVSKCCVVAAVSALFFVGSAMADVKVNKEATHSLDTASFKANVVKRLGTMGGKGQSVFTDENVEVAESHPFSLNGLNLVAVKMILKAPGGAGQQVVKLVTNQDGSMQFDSVSDVSTGSEMAASFLGDVYAPEMPKDYADVVFTGNGTKDLVMVSDPFCPYCRKAWTELVKPNRANVKSMKLGHLPLPMHPGAEVACAMMMAGEELGVSTEALVEFAYGELNPSEKPEGAKEFVFSQFAAKFPKVKELFGEGATGVEKLMKSKYGVKLQKEMAVAQEMDINGTPAFFIDGKILKGFNLESFNAMLK